MKNLEIKKRDSNEYNDVNNDINAIVSFHSILIKNTNAKIA